MKHQAPPFQIEPLNDCGQKSRKVPPPLRHRIRMKEMAVVFGHDVLEFGGALNYDFSL
jgi:hypothetical protein